MLSVSVQAISIKDWGIPIAIIIYLSSNLKIRKDYFLLSKISILMHDDNDKSLVTMDIDCTLANRKVLDKVVITTIDSPS